MAEKSEESPDDGDGGPRRPPERDDIKFTTNRRAAKKAPAKKAVKKAAAKKSAAKKGRR
jgi:hypothetical protein